MLGAEPRALDKLDKPSTAQRHPHSSHFILKLLLKQETEDVNDVFMSIYDIAQEYKIHFSTHSLTLLGYWDPAVLEKHRFA